MDRRGTLPPLEHSSLTPRRARRLGGAVVVIGLALVAVVRAQPPAPKMQPTVPLFQPTPTPMAPPAWSPIELTPAGMPPLALPPVALPPVTQASHTQPPEIPKADDNKLPPPRAVPQPNPLPFGDDKVRLPRMGQPRPLGSTPVPTPSELEEYKQFVDRVVDPRVTLDLIEGRTRLIFLKAVPTQTQVADESVAQFRLLQPAGNQLTIIGRRVGTTVMNLWFADPMEKGKEKVISYLVRVLPDPEVKERLEAVYKELEIEINKAFPNSRVRLTLVGDKLMVSGQAHDVAEATQILRIARANSPGSDRNSPQGGPAGRVPISTIGPTGNPLDPLRPEPTPGLEDYQAAGGPQVINNLRIPGEQQVMLKVVVAEVNRAAARSIGLDFSIINNSGVQVFGQLTGGLGALGGVAGGSQGGGANLPVNLNNGQVPIAINALRSLNYARSLAEPSLTTMNGQTATFQAGGQFPVPVIAGFGAGVNGGTGLQGVQFVPYGVQLMFSPIITDRDRIRLTVNATVSTRDLGASANVGGTNVPGLNTRNFGTTIELREGQTLAVAGLIQTNLGATASRVPFFGDLPVLGRAASFQQVSAGEQELVVLITPELVHPLEEKELTAYPGADLSEPGDVEFYLLGRLESRRSYDYRSPVRTDIHRMLRYRRCEELYIVGPTGHSEPPTPLPLKNK